MEKSNSAGNDRNAANHCPVWKTQSFLSKGICTVTFWQDYHGKDNLGKFYWNTVGWKFQGNLFVNRARGLFLSVYVDDIKIDRKDRRHKTDLEILMKDVDLGGTNIIPWPCKFGLHSKRVLNQQKILLPTTEVCSNPLFLLEPKKNYPPELQGNLMQKPYFLGPLTWKVTRINVWKDISNLQIKRLNHETKSQL